MKAALALVLAACSSASAPVPPSNAKPGSNDPPPRDLCERVFEHMIDLEIAKAGGSSPELRAAVKDARSDEFLRACRETPRERLECALAAKDTAALDRCDR